MEQFMETYYRKAPPVQPYGFLNGLFANVKRRRGGGGICPAPNLAMSSKMKMKRAKNIL